MTGNGQGFHALMYHEVVAPDDLPAGGRAIDVADGYADVLPDRLFVPAEEFQRQMRWLKDTGFATVTPGDLHAFYDGRALLPERAVLLTFDDLYQSVRQYAYPLLRELEFRATGFVIHDWVFGKPQPAGRNLSRTLSWPELDRMRNVFEYAHHSAGLHTRGDAGTAVQLASQAVLAEDLRRGTGGLDYPDVYAYPFGLYSEQTVRWLRDAGVSLAFTTHPGYNDARTPRLQLHRTGVFRTTTFAEFVAVLTQPRS